MAVYFIQDGEDGPIKIGYSRNPEQRVKALQTGAGRPLRLLYVMDGTTEDEAELHRRFAHLRRRGEWFTPALELRQYIACLAHPRPLYPTIIGWLWRDGKLTTREYVARWRQWYQRQAQEA